ncbi:MAG: Fe(3+) ABC transporter substrate-binding protein [Gammaproteobacteria bacterium]|nr:Fe(3+) ABC transporter substrate-binding protein [Gammaproteobacteria bacterium]
MLLIRSYFASSILFLSSMVIVGGLMLSQPTFAKEIQEVNVYSYRAENLIKPLLDQFTQETGIKVNLVTGKADALFQRLQAEGRHSPADLLLTTDAGRLYRAKEANLLQAIQSPLLEKRIPAHLRDADNQWFGLSYRARVIMYNKAKIDPKTLQHYNDLTKSSLKNKLCMRSSSNIYNQSLLASFIANQGAAKAEQWAKGIVMNLAHDPKGNDESQISGVAVGECDVTLANTYYLGNWLSNSQTANLAQQVGVIFPEQDGRGTHINVSGAGITRYAKNKTAALKLLEYMVSDNAQHWYAEANHEYPVVNGIEPSAIVKQWGYPFKTDTLPLSKLGELNAEAVRIFDRVGWQ